MSLQNSPKLDEFKNGYVEPEDPNQKSKRTWILIGVLAAVVLVLGAILFMRSDYAVMLSGKGTVTGYAVDENGNPIQVEILIFDTNIIEISDEEGAFVIRDVPAGKQSIIVAAGDIATEVEIRVVAGAENTVGTVTVPTDLLYLLEEN